MNLDYDVEVIFHFKDRKNIIEGYRPAHKIKEDYLTTGSHHYYDINDNINGIKGEIAFLSPEVYPECLWIGKEIEMYDGSRYIGYAEVIKIHNPILKKNI